jgi:hypothetical protein
MRTRPRKDPLSLTLLCTCGHEPNDHSREATHTGDSSCHPLIDECECMKWIDARPIVWKAAIL